MWPVATCPDLCGTVPHFRSNILKLENVYLGLPFNFLGKTEKCVCPASMEKICGHLSPAWVYTIYTEKIKGNIKKIIDEYKQQNGIKKQRQYVRYSLLV